MPWCGFVLAVSAILLFSGRHSLAVWLVLANILILLAGRVKGNGRPNHKAEALGRRE
jgi:uncharacterized membrane protein